MNSYRFCFQDAKGRFTGAVSQPLVDDGAALKYARKLLTVHHFVEVWRGEMRMALFNVHSRSNGANSPAGPASRRRKHRKPPLRIV